jgi:hypothetical protein
MREAFENQGKDLEWDFSVTSFRAMVDGGDKLLKEDRAKRSVRDQDRLIEYFLGNNGPANSADKTSLRIVEGSPRETTHAGGYAAAILAGYGRGTRLIGSADPHAHRRRLQEHG